MGKKATNFLIGYLIAAGVAIWLIGQFGWWLLIVLSLLVVSGWIIKTYSADNSKGASPARSAPNIISDLPHDEFGPLFDLPQTSGAYFHELMKTDPDKSMRLRKQQILRESLQIALNSKKRDTADSRMDTARDIFEKLQEEHSIPKAEWEPIRERFLRDQREFFTVKYINQAKGLLEHSSKLKTEKNRKKYVDMAKAIIDEGLSDPSSDKDRLTAFLNNLSDTIDQAQTKFQASNSISQLKKQIKGVGHPDFPFLDKTYSPNSRVPCTDFSKFIVERLQQRDVHSIKVLMGGIVEANPGLGCGPEWIDEEIESVIKAPVEKYLSYTEEIAYSELKAMWVIASKSGGKRQYWISDNDKYPLLFSRALCCYLFKLKPAFNELIEKANNCVKKWSEDSDYWKDYPRFNADMIDIPDIRESACRQKILALSIGARLHLLQAVSNGGGSLPNSTDYKTRSFGLNILDTTKEILDSGLLIPSENPEDLLSTFSRKELLATCQEKGVDFRKSWNKDKLLEALVKEAPEFVNVTLKKREIVSINPEFKDDLISIYSYSNQLENIYKVLCIL